MATRKTTTTVDEPDPFAPEPDPAPEPLEPTQPELMTEEKEPEIVETIQAQGIGPKDPYPTGNPPVSDDEFKTIHGYSRPSSGPNEGVQPLGVGPSGRGGPEPTPNEGVQPIKQSEDE